MSQYLYNKHDTTCKVLRTVFTRSLFLYQKSPPFFAHSFDFWHKNKYRTSALSMKYSLFMQIRNWLQYPVNNEWPLVSTKLLQKRSAFKESFVSKVSMTLIRSPSNLMGSCPDHEIVTPQNINNALVVFVHTLRTLRKLYWRYESPAINLFWKKTSRCQRNTTVEWVMTSLRCYDNCDCHNKISFYLIHHFQIVHIYTLGVFLSANPKTDFWS